jgi:hypothetical protein
VIVIYEAYYKINLRKYRSAIKKGQSRENGKIGYTRRRKTKQKHNTIQRNWQHRIHKTKKNKTKTQHNPEKLAT